MAVFYLDAYDTLGAYYSTYATLFQPAQVLGQCRKLSKKLILIANLIHGV